MTDDDFRLLQESAHLLAELTNHPGWTELRGLVNDKMRPETTRILNGRVTTFEDYQYSTGRLVGLQEVVDVPAAIQALLDREAVRRAEISGSE